MSRLSRGGKQAIALAITVVVAGVIYYFVIKLTGFSFHCFFREITGFLCPSCGATHMFLSLFKLDFAEAFKCNPVLFFLWPVIGGEILYVTYMGGNDKDLPKWNLALIYIIFAIMMIFGIIRNIGVNV
ncbi:MAG: DUF2752 domain-containing protein [Saccharofermentans sp.]|nr:DUF2752 domain-containing protein [Saccharofermentans sp.]